MIILPASGSIAGIAGYIYFLGMNNHLPEFGDPHSIWNLDGEPADKNDGNKDEKVDDLSKESDASVMEKFNSEPAKRAEHKAWGASPRLAD